MLFRTKYQVYSRGSSTNRLSRQVPGIALSKRGGTVKQVSIHGDADGAEGLHVLREVLRREPGKEASHVFVVKVLGFVIRPARGPRDSGQERDSNDAEFTVGAQ
jgi:hypothetical protein